MFAIVSAPFTMKKSTSLLMLLSVLVAISLVADPVFADASPLRKHKRAKRVPTEKISTLTPLLESTIAEGVRYGRYKTNGRNPILVHTIKMDRTVPGVAARIVKGENLADGREPIAEMTYRYAEEIGNNILALVNANFWTAVRNTPVGPCVIDGEVIEMNPYKKWSSAFFTADNRVLIDTFRILGSVIWGDQKFTVSNVNRRMDSLSIVVYNGYGGSTVPFVNAKRIEQAFEKAVKDSIFLEKDSTEIAMSLELLRTEIARAQLESSIEHPMVKIRVRYLRNPSLNRRLPCVVLDVDTGTVNTPLRGAVVSVPKTSWLAFSAHAGDTLFLEYTTNLFTNERFMNAVAGTPRIVRNGVARQEALKEGATGRRFITHHLARTAIGTDRSGNQLILAVVETANGMGNRGASLDDMAKIMQLLGAHQAMNLDGGGSTGMIVDGDNVIADGANPHTRPVSVGLAIVRLSHVLRSSLQYSR
ncbi:MAG: phosphodiester glycosidase family protein [Ignavibacteria bacterium]|nr:phosphodiester glycosidase family protein [Ignavibacteria bacterium]